MVVRVMGASAVMELIPAERKPHDHISEDRKDEILHGKGAPGSPKEVVGKERLEDLKVEHQVRDQAGHASCCARWLGAWVAMTRALLFVSHKMLSIMLSRGGVLAWSTTND